MTLYYRIEAQMSTLTCARTHVTTSPPTRLVHVPRLQYNPVGAWQAFRAGGPVSYGPNSTSL
jgi:hypothetical protein